MKATINNYVGPRAMRYNVTTLNKFESKERPQIRFTIWTVNWLQEYHQQSIVLLNN